MFPCLYPSVTNVTTGETLAFNVSMATGDQLVITTAPPHTANYSIAGSSVSSSRLYTLAQSSSWWGITAGVGPNAVNGGANTIEFNSQDTGFVAGTCQIQYASCFSSAT